MGQHGSSPVEYHVEDGNDRELRKLLRKTAAPLMSQSSLNMPANGTSTVGMTEAIHIAF